MSDIEWGLEAGVLPTSATRSQDLAKLESRMKEIQDGGDEGTFYRVARSANKDDISRVRTPARNKWGPAEAYGWTFRTVKETDLDGTTLTSLWVKFDSGEIVDGAAEEFEKRRKEAARKQAQKQKVKKVA